MSTRYSFLCALLIGALLAPAALAQPALPSRAAEIQAANLAHLQKLSRIFPDVSVALRPVSTETYVLVERTSYMSDWEGFFEPVSQSRFEYQDPQEGLRRDIETTYDWTGDDFAPSSRTQLVHSVSPPTLLRREQEEWDSSANAGAGGFVLTAETYNTFAGNQGSRLPSATTHQVRVGDEWQREWRILYTVGGTGLTAYYTEGETQEWVGGSDPWQPTERFLVAQSGDDVTYTEQVWEDGAWQNAERMRYSDVTILELNNRLLQFAEDIETLQGIFLLLRLPDFVVEYWEEGTWVTAGRVRTETFRDAATNLVAQVEVTEEVFEGEEWFLESRLATVYEPFQNTSRPAFTDVQEYDGDEWETFLRESYDYDAVSERMSTVTWELGDGSELFPFLRLEFTWQLAGQTSTDGGPVAVRFALEAPYPNPTTSGALLAYRMEASGPVALHVYDVLGRRVATLFEGVQTAGEHPARLDAEGLPSGLYFVRLEAPGFVHTRPLTVVR